MVLIRSSFVCQAIEVYKKLQLRISIWIYRIGLTSLFGNCRGAKSKHSRRLNKLQKKSKAFIDLCYSERTIYCSLLIHTQENPPPYQIFAVCRNIKLASCPPMELAMPCNAKRSFSSDCTTPGPKELQTPTERLVAMLHSYGLAMVSSVQGSGTLNRYVAPS